MRQSYFLIAFDSTHAAMEAEAFFEKANIKAKLIPIPSIISAGCGLSIKILPSEAAMVEPLLKQSIFADASFYKIIKENKKMNVEKWTF